MKTSRKKSIAFLSILILCAGLLAIFLPQAPTPIAEPIISEPPNTAMQQFVCDNKSTCAQMTSCAEARFFLTHCNKTALDRDHDSIPCETRWCGKNQ